MSDTDSAIVTNFTIPSRQIGITAMNPNIGDVNTGNPQLLATVQPQNTQRKKVPWVAIPALLNGYLVADILDCSELASVACVAVAAPLRSAKLVTSVCLQLVNDIQNFYSMRKR